MSGGNIRMSGGTRYIGTTDANEFRIRTFNSDRLRILANGEVSVYNNLQVGSSGAPSYRLDVNGKARITSDLGVGTTPHSSYRIRATGRAYGIHSEGSTMGAYIRDTDGTSNVYIGYSNYGIYQWTGTRNYFEGAVGIGTTEPSQKLDVRGNIYTDGSIYINNISPTIYLQDSNHRTSMIHMNDNFFYILRGCGVNSTSWCSLDGVWPFRINMTDNEVKMPGKVNIGVTTKNYVPDTSSWDFNLQLNGLDSTTIGFHDSGNSVGVIRYTDHNFYIGRNDGWGTSHMRIGGSYYCNGADLAEFTPAVEDIAKGEVVSLDEKNEGKLRRSLKAYEYNVAGVVSTDPGIVLNDPLQDMSTESLIEIKDVSTLEFDGVELALAGRVPVKVTTENGPIEVGDLLVTSSKPGYAMRGDRDIIKDMPGVVLGKAMGSLAEGEGEIVVLVNL